MEKKKGAPVRFEGVQRGFLSERKVKVTPCRWAENRNEKKKRRGNQKWRVCYEDSGG